MKKDLRLSTLSYTLFETLAAIDHGHLKTISVDEFYRGLDAGTLLEDIQKKVGDDIDLSLVTSQAAQRQLLLEVLEATRAALEGRERRKTGIEKSGLCLLATYVTEAIQQYGWDTGQDRARMDKETY
jgi:hypothetical protein